MDFDFGYDSTKKLIQTDIEKFVQEIDFCLSLGGYEVFGRISNDKKLEDIIWNTTANESDVRAFIDNKIKTECYYSSIFSYSINVQFAQGETRDVCLVELDITPKYDSSSSNMIERKISILYQ